MSVETAATAETTTTPASPTEHSTAVTPTTTASTKTTQTEHHNLFSWLRNITEHHNDTTASSTSFSPKIKKVDMLTPIIPSEDNDAHSSATSSGKNSRRSSHVSPLPIHFHKPHGLLEKLQTYHLHQEQRKQQQQQQASIDSGKRRSSTITANDADDEHEEDVESVRSSPDVTKILSPFTAIDILHSNNSVKSFASSRRSSRENSIVPSDLDSPEIGYKKLKQDGNLVDYDDISVLAEEERYGHNKVIEIQAQLRSVIRNDLIRLAVSGPFQSPLLPDDHHRQQKKQVLHVGCGNGNWCVDMARLFPQWLILGMDDKSGGPVQDQRKVPKNFKYIRCYYDLLITLHDIPENSFDLVFARFLIFSYGEEDYVELIKQCERICKPGGYVELYELDMRIYGNPEVGPMTHKLNGKVFRVMELHGLKPRMARKLGDMVSDIFHTHDQETLDSDPNSTYLNKKKHFDTNYTSLPLGVWGGKLGVMFRDDINDLYEFFKINQGEDTSDEEGGMPFYKEIETMDDEMETQKAFMNLYHVYVRKCSLAGVGGQQQELFFN